jgi:hypothetical protein
MKFFSNALDAITGRKHAVNAREVEFNNLREAVQEAKANNSRELHKHFSDLVANLGLSDTSVIINKLRYLQEQFPAINDAIASCLENDASKVEAVLNDPHEYPAYLSVIQYDPLHLLLALQKHHEMDFKKSILKLIANESLDYKYTSYGINPVSEIFKMGDKFLLAMRNRILKDIVKAIDNMNFVQALILLDYDKEYFKTAIVPHSNGHTILFYAAKAFGVAEDSDLLIKLINSLIYEYGFDINARDKDGLTCLEYLEHNIDILLLQTEHVSSVRLLESTNQSIDLYKDYYNQLTAAEIKRKILCFYHNINEYNLQGQKVIETNHFNVFEFNEYGRILKVKYLNIVYETAVFIAQEIIPYVASIELWCLQIDHGCLQVIFDALSDNQRIKSISINTVLASGYKDLFKNIPSLCELSVMSCNSSAESLIEDVAQNIKCGNLPKLSKIELAHMPTITINDDSLFILYERIYQRGNLKNIKLHEINVEPKFLQLLAKLLGKNTQVETISLERIYLLEAAKVKSLFEIFNNSKNLSEISIQHCTPSGESINLLEEIKNLTKVPIRLVHNSGLACELDTRTVKALPVKKEHVAVELLENDEQITIRIKSAIAKFNAALDGSRPENFKVKDTTYFNPFKFDIYGRVLQIKRINIDYELANFLAQEILPYTASIFLCGLSISCGCLQILFDAVKNVNFKKIHFHDVLHTDYPDIFKNTPLLREFSMTSQRIDVSKFVEHLTQNVKQGKLAKFYNVEFENVGVISNMDALLTLYKHMYKVGGLENIKLHEVGLDLKFFKCLVNLLRNDTQVESISLESVNLVEPEKVQCLLEILNSCSNLREIQLRNCTPGGTSIELIKKIKDLTNIPTRIIENSGIGCGINIRQAAPKAALMFAGEKSFVAEPAPISQTIAVDKKLAAFKQLISKKSNLGMLDKLGNNVYVTNLNPLQQQDLFNLVDKYKINANLTASDVLNAVNNDLLSQIAELKTSFFTSYLAQIKTDNFANWQGSVNDLHVVARILSANIHLHCETLQDKIKVYGGDWEKNIHILRKGSMFYGFLADSQLIIPNTADNLNLFRACIHANLDANGSILQVKDSDVMVLRILAGKCLGLSQQLCEPDYLAAIDEYLLSSESPEIDAAIKKLPQFNLEIMRQLMAYKNMASVVTAASSLLNSQNITVASMLHQVLQVIFNFNNSSTNTFNLDAQVCNDSWVDIENSSIAHIKKQFNDKYQRELASVTANLEAYFAKHKTLIDVMNGLYQDVVKNIDANNAVIDKLKCEKEQEIQANYKRNYRKMKGELLKTLLVTAATYAVGNFLGPVMQSVFASSWGALNTTLVSNALVSSFFTSITSSGPKDKKFIRSFIGNCSPHKHNNLKKYFKKHLTWFLGVNLSSLKPCQ